MKKLTKTELNNALCAVQLEHAKKRLSELNCSLAKSKDYLVLSITDFIEELCSDDLKLYDFICDNFDNLTHCKFNNDTIHDEINDRRTISSEYAYVKSQIDCPGIIKKRVDYLRDPTMTVTIEDGQTIYDNETLEAERKRIFGD